MELPPWLTRDYSPVETYLRAFQTGAQISEQQTRLAEQQRQANMEAQARQEQLQSVMLRAMTETAVQKAYQEQQIALRQQDLAQEKQRNQDLATKALMDSLVQQRHYQAMEQKGTALEQNIDAAMLAESKAKALEASGDIEGAKQERERAALIQGSLKPPGWQFSTDESGRPIVTYGEMKTTPATASRAEQKLDKVENGIQLINNLQQRLEAGHVGIAGLGGEYLWDKGLVQMLNLMGDGTVKADPNRTSSRTALVMLREGLMKDISDDSRFSQPDRIEIMKALPSSGPFESVSHALNQLSVVKNVLKDRSKVYARRINAQPPLFSLEPDEINDLYRKGKITRQQALDALMRFN